MHSRRPRDAARKARRLRLENLETRLNPSSGPGWHDIAALPKSPTNADAYIHPDHYRSFDATVADLRNALKNAPSEAAVHAGAKPIDLVLPAPDGTDQHFRVNLVPVMAPELAAKFPEIQTYEGTGVTDRSARLRMDISPSGFHAQVLSAVNSWYIDPYYFRENTVHISYFGSDLRRDGVFPGKGPNPSPPKDAGTVPSEFEEVLPDASNTPSAARLQSGNLAARSGTQLRTYRLAVAATGEYTAKAGGTVPLAMQAIVNVVNRISGVYEDELSIRLVLVANENQLIFTNAATDPYTNTSVDTMLAENQSAVDSIIGNANYDIGHVVSTSDDGGIAGAIGNVGIPGQKAEGATGTGTGGSPTGDPFAIDFVAHEMGHQFGGHHSFDSANELGAVDPPHNMEPGSGSTIMSYAGVTGSDSDLQPHSDAMFNSGSFDDIIDYVDNVIPTVGTRTATGNLVPVVDAGPNFAIPARTPFVLTAPSASDGNNDPLTYSWEERDIGPLALLSTPDDGAIPLFRVYNPTTDPSRTFPRLTDLVNNTTALGEKLPTVNRGAMQFRVTVRDNRVGGGGVNTDDMQVDVVDTGAAFAVTSPNTATTWVVGDQQTVTWNVAGTTAAPINAANVKITLSLDGGLTYPITLAASVPNTGSATVTVPNDLTTHARVRVQAVGGIFFDISNANFTISTTAPTFEVSGKVYEDWTGNGAPDPYDRGVVGQTVLFDTNNNGQLDSATTSSGPINIAIPDDDSTGITHSINVSGMPTSLDHLTVNLTITHTWGGDLIVELKGPNNVTIPLITRRGGSGTQFLGTTLDDYAGVPISGGGGDFTGVFQPETPLGTFDGINPNGVWTLHVADLAAEDVGILENWSLTMPKETTATTAGDGTYGTSGLPVGTYQVRTLLDASGYNLVSPASGSYPVTINSPSDTNPNKNFGIGLQNAIYGLVVADANSNSIFDAGDPGLAGIEVYQDQNNNHSFDTGEPSLTTDSLGRYVFTSQPTGTAVLRDVLTGAELQSFPAGGSYTTNLTFNQTIFGQNFGVIVGSAPVITSDGGGPTATINVEEGTTLVTTVAATDVDPGTTLTYSIAGGPDATKFTIDPSTGVLSFLNPPLISPPGDADGDGVYLVTVQASDGFLTDQQAISISITTANNHAPVLDNSGSPTLKPIPEGMPSPAGDTVTSMLGTSVTDVNLNALQGMAVVGLSNTASGTWEFSTDAGTSWTPFGAVAETAALDLRPEDFVRFVPNAGFVHVVSITYHAWDQTSDAPADTVDLTGNTGGATAYSVATETATLRVAQTLTPTVEDSKKSTGDPTGGLLSAFVADPDANAKRGMAVIGVTGPTAGVWQYSSNGKTWKTMPAVSLGDALLLKDTDHIRFLPDTDQTGYAMISYRAWDQTIGKSGTLADLTGPAGSGGSTAFSTVGDVAFAKTIPANDRPLLDKGGNTLLTNVVPSDNNPPGDTIARLIGTTVVDVDANSVHGIAITSVPKAKVGGTWQFSTDAGTTWQPFPAVTTKAALLLRPEDLVRFLPTAGATGSASFMFKAWDQTEGTFGTATANTTSKTSTAYSTAIETAFVNVTSSTAAVNHAPVLSSSPNALTVQVTEDVKSKGDPISTLLALGTTITDTDAGALKGVAVTGVTGLDHGRWEWSSNGVSWKPITPVSEADALLLRGTDKIRYVSNLNDTTGGETLNFRAWDETRGSFGNRADLTVPNATGGASPFSAAVENTSVVLTPTNDAPILKTSGFPVLPPPLANGTPVAVTVSSFADSLITDIDAGALRGIAVTKAKSQFGIWEFSTDAGVSWLSFPPVSDLGALLLRPADMVRVRPNAGGSGTATLGFRAWDQTFGTFGALAPTKGWSAFSRSFETATIAYNILGDARPMMDTSGNPVISSPNGSTVASLIGSTITDPNVTDVLGIAVTSAVSSAKTGTWQFSLDNGATWVAMGTVSTNSAILLRGSDLIRFVPTAGYLGTQKLSFKAWDRTEGSVGLKSKTSTAGFSKEIETAIVNVNTAPTLTL
jgi:subtilisin-like proprotein convertase family protein